MTSNGQYIFPRFPPPEGCNEVLTISIEALTSLHGNMMNHILTVLSGISDDDTLSRDGSYWVKQLRGPRINTIQCQNHPHPGTHSSPFNFVGKRWKRVLNLRLIQYK